MPYPEDPHRFDDLFENHGRWVTGYDANTKSTFPLRATVTLSFLRTAVAFSLVFVAGEGKKPALLRTLAEEGTLAETPARIIQQMKTVILVTNLSIA